MYLNQKTKNKVIIWVIALLFSSVPFMGNLSVQGNQIKQDKVALSGRVLAYVNSTTFGSGLGPKYEKFIFGMESKSDLAGQPIMPVLIIYAFHKTDGRLPPTFFDYNRVHELRVVRDQNCDQKVSDLSSERNETENGTALPDTYILQPTDGAPRDLLKPEGILPCYILTPSGMD